METPVHFCAYGRDWKTNSELVQPEIVFRPEREALLSIAFRLKSVVNIGNTPTSEFLNNYIWELTIKTRYLLKGNLFFNQLTGKSGRSGKSKVKNENDISYLMRRYHYNVYSTEFAGIDLLFRTMQEGFDTHFDYWGGDGCFKEAKYLSNRSIEDALLAPGDGIEVGDLLSFKGSNFLKQVLRVIPAEEFARFNTEFIQSHPFRGFSYEEYCGELEKRFGVSLLNLTRKLYSERGLPAYYFRDARVDDVETPGEKEGFVFSIKAWNKGNSDGILSIKRLYSGTISREQHYLISAGACKEIKVYFEGTSEGAIIGVLTNVSRNVPSCYDFGPFAKKGRVKEATDGFFDADTLVFAPNPGVYIVDNDDPGCRVIEESRVVQKFLWRKNYKNTPWDWATDQGAYGELARSYLEKKSGQGDSDVEWEVDLPEAGAYELFVYNNKPLAGRNNTMSFYSRGKKERQPVQRYRFVHADGEKKVAIAPLRTKDGWVSLGTYRFHAGKAKVTLSGRGADPHQYLYADAVKWVKVR